MGAFLGARRRLLAQRGRPMALSRGTGGAVLVTGYARDFRADELVAGIKQGDIRVEVLAEELAAAGFTPRPGDRLMIDGRTKTLQGAFAVNEGAAVIGYSLWASGN